MEINVRNQLNILIQLAEADKHFAETERDMILRIAKAHDFSEEEVRSLIRNPEPIDNLETLFNDQKFDYLIMCIRLMFADHKIFEKELIFAKHIATKLGFKNGAVDYIVENFEKRSNDELKSKIVGEYL